MKNQIEKFLSSDFADEIVTRKKKKQASRYSKKKEGSVVVTWIEILEKVNEYNKEIGHYISLEETEDLEDGTAHLANKTAKYLKLVVKKKISKRNPRILIAGLGNEQYLSDALGPLVMQKIYATAHLTKEKEYKKLAHISTITPGVMSKTGMESSLIVKSIIEKMNIDILIVIDSLATRSMNRLFKTVQISDTGISPGSGVENHRFAINEETMGIPVIGLGVATVMDTASLVHNVLQGINPKLDNAQTMNIIKQVVDNNEKMMVVTSKEIDKMMERISNFISRSINLCFNPLLCQ